MYYVTSRCHNGKHIFEDNIPLVTDNRANLKKKRREKEKEIWNGTKFLINASLNAAIDTSSTLFTGHVIYRGRFILKKKKKKEWKETETKRR